MRPGASMVAGGRPKAPVSAKIASYAGTVKKGPPSFAASDERGGGKWQRMPTRLERRAAHETAALSKNNNKKTKESWSGVPAATPTRKKVRVRSPGNSVVVLMVPPDSDIRSGDVGDPLVDIS